MKKNEYLTQKELQTFKELLLEKRNEILGDVLSMEDGTLNNRRNNGLPQSASEDVSDNYELENTLGLMDSERKILEEIDEALERVANKSYGICVGSGKPIPKARLLAIPWAKYCIEFATMLEKNGKIPGSNNIAIKYDYGDEEQDGGSVDAYRRNNS